jgi:hypothetical protein
MQQWKVANRSKIDDSKIEEPVRRCLETTTSDAIRKKAESLATYWKDRPEVFRIPRRVHVVCIRWNRFNGVERLKQFD